MSKLIFYSGNAATSGEQPQQPKIQDKSRPISSTPVPGTPWCVVWTGDGRVFFYNPSSRTSVWERPEDLVGRADVDKMLATPPDVLVPPQGQAGKPENSSLKRTESESSDSEEGTPAKKPKKDEVVPGKKHFFSYLYRLYYPSSFSQCP